VCPCAAHQEREKGHSFRTRAFLFSCNFGLVAHVPLSRLQNDGCLNFVDENDEVLISGFGRRGKAKGDIPGVRFKVVKVSGVGLLALWKEKKVCCYRPNLFSISPLMERLCCRKSLGHNHLPHSLSSVVSCL
jgi:hypothetical protein